MFNPIYKQPLTTLLLCAVVGVLAAFGVFGRINNFPLIFAGFTVLGGFWEIWKQRPRSAVVARSALLLLAGSLALAGWMYHQRNVLNSLEQRSQAALAVLGGSQAPTIRGFEALNVTSAELDRALSLSGEVTIVTFWARWCSPCWRELDELEELYQENKDRGLRVLALTRYDTPGDASKRRSDTEKAKAFLQRKRLSFPAAIGIGTDTYSEFAVRSIPTAVLIGRDGRVVDYALSISRARDLMDKAVGLL